jgi:hypothetical protein
MVGAEHNNIYISSEIDRYHTYDTHIYHTVSEVRKFANKLRVPERERERERERK